MAVCQQCFNVTTSVPQYPLISRMQLFRPPVQVSHCHHAPCWDSLQDAIDERRKQAAELLDQATTLEQINGAIAALSVHASDKQCTLDASDRCMVCGVVHGDPCPECHQRGYHKPNCPVLKEEEGAAQ